ncbi:hypothetical protein P7C73_g2051, partial [Tremellales sp. Uapishka_1]
MADHDIYTITSLPTFEGLFCRHTSSLLKPFSLFSLFRSTPTLPSLSLLQPIFNPATFTPIKSLVSLQSFSTQLRDALLPGGKGGKPTEIDERLSQLLLAYLHAFHLTSQVLWEQSVYVFNSADIEDMKKAQRQALEGVFLLYDHLQSSLNESITSAISEINSNLLASIFPASNRHYLLTPIFIAPRALVSRLQHQESRPTAGNKRLAALPSSTTAICEEQATNMLLMLELFVARVSAIRVIPISISENKSDHGEGDESTKELSKKRRPLGKRAAPLLEKETKQEEESRSLRIALEGRLLLVDLALTLATSNIKQVQVRAHQAPVSELESESESGLSDCEEDVKQEIGPADEHATHPETEPEPSKWGPRAEEALVSVLLSSRDLLSEGRAAVVSSLLTRTEWLDDPVAPEDIPLPSTPRKSPSPSDEDDSNAESDEDFGSESEDENSEDAINQHACPLRTLFRLHDRYEEQRLAIWLSLPQEQRGKMTAFMRGEDGRVGEAWDEFGAVALVDYDSETLLSFGLSGDKLDKWIELAARRNAKKIRRRARKTV